MTRMRAGLGVGLVVSASLALAGLCAGVGLSGLAVYHRILPPPAFSVRLGDVEIAAPCPPSEIVCEKYPAFFAVWRGARQPSGSMKYRLMWFVYLSPKR